MADAGGHESVPDNQPPVCPERCPRDCGSPCCVGQTTWCIAQMGDAEFLVLADEWFAVDGGLLFPPAAFLDGLLRPPRS